MTLSNNLKISNRPKLQNSIAVRAWTKWEMMTAHLLPNEENIKKGDDDKFSLAFARIENHYFVLLYLEHPSFFEPKALRRAATAITIKQATKRKPPLLDQSWRAQDLLGAQCHQRL
ncbi:uncharacterized protein LOC132295108 isoform X1 [Cornus florida]|uniref:uncharacterized protein LOC132295108 isoform X1 n=1 Tax=Cornus florida TaxID=4283 RepID=UPI0028988BE3|nr:uncharacterized protein LOC132295108 isoform X1 [Cornus florida]